MVQTTVTNWHFMVRAVVWALLLVGFASMGWSVWKGVLHGQK